MIEDNKIFLKFLKKKNIDFAYCSDNYHFSVRFQYDFLPLCFERYTSDDDSFKIKLIDSDDTMHGRIYSILAISNLEFVLKDFISILEYSEDVNLDDLRNHIKVKMIKSKIDKEYNDFHFFD